MTRTQKAPLNARGITIGHFFSRSKKSKKIGTLNTSVVSIAEASMLCFKGL